MKQPMDLDYARGSTAPRRPVFSSAGCVCGLIAAIHIGLVASLSRIFASIFRDFNVQLPAVTQILIDSAYYLHTTLFLPLLLLPLAGGFLAPFIDRTPRSPGYRYLRGGILMYVTGSVCGLITAFAIIALFIPLTRLMGG